MLTLLYLLSTLTADTRGAALIANSGAVQVEAAEVVRRVVGVERAVSGVLK